MSATDQPDILRAHTAALSVEQFHALLKLRIDVFVVEQECPYPELDGRDMEPGTEHLWIARGDDPIAYLRTLDDGPADGLPTVRIGRVVTDPAHRSHGLAAVLVDHVVDEATGALVLDAQSYLVEWYEARGFRVCGDEFIEDGIAHVPMRREAPAPEPDN